MSKIIAMAGKGGTGKTTMSALLVNYLVRRGMTPVLAVDADSNANLNELLGVEVEMTIGQARKALKDDMPPGMTRDQFMEMKVHQALIEESGFDLLVMGQPDGPGCYCAANQYLAMTMDQLAGNYPVIVVDNEAGMEHLSRMNLRDIDLLMVTSDPSARGIMTARRISELTGPLGINVRKQCLVVNRAPDPAPDGLTARIDEAVSQDGLEFGGMVPASPELVDQELSGASYLDLDESVPAVKTAFGIFDRVLPAG